MNTQTKRKTHSIKANEQTKALIAEEYANGELVVDLSEKYGYSESTIRIYIREHNDGYQREYKRRMSEYETTKFPLQEYFENCIRNNNVVVAM